MTREEIIKTIYKPLTTNVEDMWLISIVFKDELGYIDNTYAFFKDRRSAEKWFSSIVSDGRPYYAYCCDENCWNKASELLGE